MLQARNVLKWVCRLTQDREGAHVPSFHPLFQLRFILQLVSIFSRVSIIASDSISSLPIAPTRPQRRKSVALRRNPPIAKGHDCSYSRKRRQPDLCHNHMYSAVLEERYTHQISPQRSEPSIHSPRANEQQPTAKGQRTQNRAARSRVPCRVASRLVSPRIHVQARQRCPVACPRRFDDCRRTTKYGSPSWSCSRSARCCEDG